MHNNNAEPGVAYRHIGHVEIWVAGVYTGVAAVLQVAPQGDEPALMVLGEDLSPAMVRAVEDVVKLRHAK